MFTGRGGFAVNDHHGSTFLGLSQAYVAHAGFATSALLAPRLFSKGDYRYGGLSRSLKSTLIVTSVALTTLYSGVALRGHQPERDPPFVYGGGTSSGATTTFSADGGDSMVRTRATGSSAGSSSAGRGRRSTLRSSRLSGQCPLNSSRRVEARRNGGGSDGNNNENSGSGGNPSLPVVEEKSIEVAKARQPNLVRNKGAPPPPPPPPPPSTSAPEDDNWASPKKRTSICAALITAAVLGLLSRKLRYSKHRQLPYEHVRYCVPSSDAVAQKPRRLGKFTSAPRDIPLDCGPSGKCIPRDHAVDPPEIDPVAQILAVGYVPCPAGYTEVHFKDIGSHQAQLAPGTLTPQLRPLNWHKISQSVVTIQLKSLRVFVIGIGVVMAAFLGLNLLSAVYYFYASRKKHADKPQCASSADEQCEVILHTKPPESLVKEIKNEDIYDHAIHANTEQPTTSPAPIKVQPVVPPVVKHDGDFHSWDLGPPLAAFSVTPHEPAIHEDIEQPTTSPPLIKIQPAVPPIVEHDDNLQLLDLGPPIAPSVMPYEHAIHTDVEHLTASPSPIKIRPVVPPVDGFDDDFHLWDLGPPLAESSLIHPNELDESGFQPIETFYQDDVSFNLDEVYADLQEEEILLSTTQPPTDFVVNGVKSKGKGKVEALAANESFNIDDIYVPFDEEDLKTDVTPFPIEKGITETLDMDIPFSSMFPSALGSSSAEVVVAENGSDAPAGENSFIENGVTVITGITDAVPCSATLSFFIPAISQKASIADDAVAQNGFDAPAEEVPIDEARTTFEDFFAMTDSVVQSYMAARNLKGKDRSDSFSSRKEVAFNPLAAPFISSRAGALTPTSQDDTSDNDSVDEGEGEKRQRDYRRRRKRPKKKNAIQTAELISEAPESTMAETLPHLLC